MDNIFNLCRFYDDNKFISEALDLIVTFTKYFRLNVEELSLTVIQLHTF
jgi:hypothetical protein